MTAIISRSQLIATATRVIEDTEARATAIAAINRIYLENHTNFTDQESGYFNLVTHYDLMHRSNPARYNQQTLTEGANALHA